MFCFIAHHVFPYLFTDQCLGGGVVQPSIFFYEWITMICYHTKEIQDITSYSVRFFFPYRWWGLAVSMRFCKLNFCLKSLASAGFFPAIPPLEPLIFLLSSMIRSNGGKLMLLFDTQNLPSSNSFHDLELFSCTFSIVASHIIKVIVCKKVFDKAF